MEFLIAVQGWIRQSITANLNAFAATRDWAALFLILPLGIGFGAVHALTPEHGKTVLASYLFGSRLAVLRGVLSTWRRRGKAAAGAAITPVHFSL
jgi:nickel/cobalt exporter